MNQDNKLEDSKICKEIFWNLLKYSKNNSLTLPTHFIRELEQTKQCDNIANLQFVRESYKGHMSEQVHDAIMKQTHRDDDLEFIACQTVIHYTRKQLVSVLPFHLKVYSNTVERAESIFEALGYFTSSYGSRRVIENYINNVFHK